MYSKSKVLLFGAISIHQCFLRTVGLVVDLKPIFHWVINALAIQFPGILRVSQICQQTLINDALSKGGIIDGPGNLNAPEHIAVHPVGT